MAGYALRYAFWSLLFFALIYFEGFSPLFFFNQLQTELTSILTAFGISLSGLPIRMDAPLLLFESGTRLQILDSCNGLAPFLLYAAALLAYPAYNKQKLTGIVLGYLVLMLLNMARIMLILYEVSLDPANLTWTHDYVGRYGMGVMTLMLFWLFTEKVEVCTECGGRFALFGNRWSSTSRENR